MSDRITLKGSEANGASAIACELDNTVALTTAGAKLLSLRNATVEKFAIDKDGRLSGTSLPVQVVKPSEGDLGIMNAMNTMSGLGGGIVQLIAGTYVIDGTIFSSSMNNVTLQGIGPSTILQHDGILTGAMIYFQGGYGTTEATDNITKNDNVITLTTHANAGSVTQGNYISIRGLDPDGLRDYEYNIAAANGDPDTGIVTLLYPIQKTLTSVTMTPTFHGKNITIRDLRMTSSGPLTSSYAIRLQSCSQTIIERVYFDTMNADAERALIDFDFTCVNNIIRECKFSNIIGGCIYFNNQIAMQVLDCDFIDIAQNLTSYKGAVQFGADVCDIEISRNSIHRSGTYGIMTGAGASPSTRRILINDNLIKSTGSVAIGDVQSDTIIEDNLIEDTGTAPAITYVGDKNIIIKGNIIKNAATGIDGITDGSEVLISNNNIIKTTSIGIRSLSNDAIISNNILKDTVNYGIWARGGSSIISGNKIINVTGTGTGIVVDTGNSNIISENMVTGATLGMNISTNDNIITSNHCNGLGITITGTGNISSLNKE